MRNALEKYNKLAVKQNPLRPVLQYSEVLSYATLGDFNLLKHSRHVILAKPWSNIMHHQMAVKYFKLLSAHEEIGRLNIEVRWLQAWVDVKTKEIEQVAEEVEAQDPLLSAELWALTCCQRHINIQHQLRLQHIYNIDGYSGVWPVVGQEGEDEDEAKELEGDEAVRLDACMNVMSC